MKKSKSVVSICSLGIGVMSLFAMNYAHAQISSSCSDVIVNLFVESGSSASYQGKKQEIDQLAENACNSAKGRAERGLKGQAESLAHDYTGLCPPSCILGEITVESVSNVQSSCSAPNVYESGSYKNYDTGAQGTLYTVAVSATASGDVQIRINCSAIEIFPLEN